MLDVVACADLLKARAKAKAKAHAIPRACSVPRLLADPRIEIVVNLTTPDAHAEIALAVLQAGKHVYNEKPLAVTREDGARILGIAKEKGLIVGAAPDTFLGGAIQTCRKLIDEGRIGKPVAAAAFMLNHGHEHWHPDPEFYYQPGGGPMFDMGPYYLTALVSLLGSVQEVGAFAATTFAERTITSQPHYGARIKVNTPTHIAGLMRFANGAIGTIVTSFDVWAHELPHIEIYGSEGSLSVPDPNRFGGAVAVRDAEAEEWSSAPLTHGYIEKHRGIGVADMAYALRCGRPHRAHGQMAYHVLDIMHSFLDSSRSGAHITMESLCERPAPLPPGLQEGVLAE